MAITIPVIVLAGSACFFIFFKKLRLSGKLLLYGMILFIILFPMFLSFWRNQIFTAHGDSFSSCTGDNTGFCHGISPSDGSF